MLYGQRVHYASVLAPAEPRAVSFVGYRDDGNGEVVEGAGLPNPVYFVAVASDGPLPALPAGLFIPQKIPYLREIALLNRELESQQDLVGAAALRESSLRLELDQRRQQVDALVAHSSKLDAELVARSAEADALRQQHATLLSDHATLVGNYKELERECVEAVRLIEAVHSSAARRIMKTEVARNTGSIVGHRQPVLPLKFWRRRHRATPACQRWASPELDADARPGALRRPAAGTAAQRLPPRADRACASRSWRFMAPLRRVSVELRNVSRLGYMGTAMAGRLAWRALPLPMSLKLRLKHQVFARMGPAFATTGAYRRWQVAMRQQNTVAATAGTRGHCTGGHAIAIAACGRRALGVAGLRWDARPHRRGSCKSQGCATVSAAPDDQTGQRGSGTCRRAHRAAAARRYASGLGDHTGVQRPDLHDRVSACPFGQYAVTSPSRSSSRMTPRPTVRSRCYRGLRTCG